MRIFFSVLLLILVAGFCLILDTKLLLPAPMGKLLAPQHGIWQNAESTSKDFSFNLDFPDLEGSVNVYLDDRLVPHVFAEKENDVYFVQGFLHAKFRLWQMELQTLSAAGRASEVVGEIAVNHDREFRRLGMVFAAENSLREIEADQNVKKQCDAYTAGVNAYISTLTASSLPLEYKLLGYQPEKWSNLKTALFLKYMAYDLAAHENDFELTNARNHFSKKEFDLLYPSYQDSLDPIIPRDSVYASPKVSPIVPMFADSIYFLNDSIKVQSAEKPDRENGSNNWAVHGSKTKSGAPILCNDPHLGLNLPSLWFEMQLSTPSFNAYGATFPGAPGVIIGFNDHCAFGFTNAGRDVRDYYSIKFKDNTRQEYWFNGKWMPSNFRMETIKIAGKPNFIDTVVYTHIGPVMYDRSFAGKRAGTNGDYAVRWKAHDASNELRIFNMLNRASNYSEYREAVSNLHTPGQNVVFAAKNGDIALCTQGEFPAKWKGQGDFVMPGTDSSYLWQAMIPNDETPFQYNPLRGFVSSANQRPVDSTYPYYLGREYPSARGFIINRKLANMQQITVQDMMRLQTDNYNVFAEMARPILTKYIKKETLTTEELKYWNLLTAWNLRSDASSKGATVFNLTWDNLRDTIYQDELAKAPQPVLMPFESTLLESLLKDSSYRFVDDINTSQQETIFEMVTAAFKKAAITCKTVESNDKLEWSKFKATHVTHLLRLPAFSRENLPIGGGRHIINATRDNHGPSWRMIVSLTKETEAFGVYPGGQNGNPGSKYYDDFVDYWVSGRYYSLWMMKKNETDDARIKWKMLFSKS